MSELKTNKISPATGTALAVGDSGDAITVPSGATLDISASTLTPPATMPASSGINFTALNATNLGSGTVPTARLGSGTADATTFLRGDQTYASAGGDNTPSFFIRGTSTQAIANETWTKVTFAGAEGWDTDSAFSSDKFTVPADEDGKYFFTYGGCMSELDDGEYYAFTLYKNGSEWSGGDRLGQIMDRMTGGNLGTSMNGSVAMPLVATDYVEVYIFHSEGGTNNLLNNQCYFQGWKMIGV